MIFLRNIRDFQPQKLLFNNLHLLCPQLQGNRAYTAVLRHIWLLTFIKKFIFRIESLSHFYKVLVPLPLQVQVILVTLLLSQKIRLNWRCHHDHRRVSKILTLPRNINWSLGPINLHVSFLTHLRVCKDHFKSLTVRVLGLVVHFKAPDILAFRCLDDLADIPHF